MDLGMGKECNKILSQGKPIFVHGYFIYECQSCGSVYRMWVEKGLEEHDENHKPVPFVISCKECFKKGCIGMAQDVSMRIIDKEELIKLPDGANYFANSKKSDCGVPKVIKADAKDLYAFRKMIYAEELKRKGEL